MSVISLQLITTQEQADMLITNAQKDRRSKSHMAEGIDMNADTSEENVLRTQTELAVAQSELASLTAIIANLPEGKTKDAEVTKKMTLELKIRKLTLSDSNASVEYVLDKEYDYALLQAQIVKIDEIIADLQARKAEL